MVSLNIREIRLWLLQGRHTTCPLSFHVWKQSILETSFSVLLPLTQPYWSDDIYRTIIIQIIIESCCGFGGQERLEEGGGCKRTSNYAGPVCTCVRWQTYLPRVAQPCCIIHTHNTVAFPNINERIHNSAQQLEHVDGRWLHYAKQHLNTHHVMAHHTNITTLKGNNICSS